jgi:hypothetical protein
MASRIDISEYSQLMIVGGSAVPIGREPAITDQDVLIQGGAVASAPFNAATQFVRIHADAICSILFSTNGTPATANNKRMSANQTEYFGVNPGDVVSVITST